MRRLQKFRATTFIEVLEDLIDSLPEWNHLLNNLEGDISRSAIVNTSSLVSAFPAEENIGAHPSGP